MHLICCVSIFNGQSNVVYFRQYRKAVVLEAHHLPSSRGEWYNWAVVDSTITYSKLCPLFTRELLLVRWDYGVACGFNAFVFFKIVCNTSRRRITVNRLYTANLQLLLTPQLCWECPYTGRNKLFVWLPFFIVFLQERLFKFSLYKRIEMNKNFQTEWVSHVHCKLL